MNTYAHTTNYKQTILTYLEDGRLPVTKGSTRDVTSKMAQFKMEDVSNIEMKTVFRERRITDLT